MTTNKGERVTPNDGSTLAQVEDALDDVLFYNDAENIKRAGLVYRLLGKLATETAPAEARVQRWRERAEAAEQEAAEAHERRQQAEARARQAEQERDDALASAEKASALARRFKSEAQVARQAGYEEATEHAAMWCADHVGPDAARSLRRGAHRRTPAPTPKGPEPAPPSRIDHVQADGEPVWTFEPPTEAAPKGGTREPEHDDNCLCDGCNPQWAEPPAAPLEPEPFAPLHEPAFVHTDEYGDTLTIRRFPECWSFFVDPGDAEEDTETVAVKVPNAEAVKLARVLAPAAAAPQGAGPLPRKVSDEEVAGAVERLKAAGMVAMPDWVRTCMEHGWWLDMFPEMHPPAAPSAPQGGPGPAPAGWEPFTTDDGQPGLKRQHLDMWAVFAEGGSIITRGFRQEDQQDAPRDVVAWVLAAASPPHGERPEPATGMGHALAPLVEQTPAEKRKEAAYVPKAGDPPEPWVVVEGGGLGRDDLPLISRSWHSGTMYAGVSYKGWLTCFVDDASKPTAMPPEAAQWLLAKTGGRDPRPPVHPTSDNPRCYCSTTYRCDWCTRGRPTSDESGEVE